MIRKTTYSDSGDHRAAANYSPAYRDLKKASDDLMKLINSSQGHANKELNKMRREIEAIVAKYGTQEG